MSVSMKDLDPAFHGAGQKDGLEVWRIENFKPVPVPRSSHGKFYMGDSYIILKTTALKNGSFRHDIHYWLGKDTSQDEAGTAAILTVELDAALGGRAVQYRELQGNETEKLLSYFRPCIMPQPGGVASGFNHVEVNEQEHFTRLYVCKGKHVVHVKEVPFARPSLNHEDIFILDTKSKIFQFNGSHSCIQERAKALEVVQYIKDTFHEGKCEVAAVEDGRLMADAEAGEFWALFGGFAPLPKKSLSEDSGEEGEIVIKLLCANQGKTKQINYDSLARELLESNKCYLLDCGAEMYVWMGRNTSLQERKGASEAAEKLLIDDNRTKSHVIKVIEGFETVMFKSKFVEWPPTPDLKLSSEDGRGKVAALLKSQGLNVKGLMKAAPVKEEPQPYIDCTGHLQVWRVNGNEKALLATPDQSKFYTGDCYIFQYTYTGDDNEECLIGTWFGKKSVEVERASAMSLASKMVQAAKFQAVQARLYEGKEPIQFFVIFQSLQVFKGGLSSGYKNFIAENGIVDDTYSEGGIALFRVQGSGSENMQALQVDAVASSLNSTYCYILHNGNTVFTWTGNLTTSLDHDLVERQLDAIKPDLPSRSQKEGRETDQFWEVLGGKSKYTNQKVEREHESDPHLFSCVMSKGNIKVKEIHHFTQDDLMTEDVFVLDCHSDIFVWVGQEVDAKVKSQAMDIGEKFLVLDFLMEKLSRETPIFTVSEGSEPQYFTRFFNWDSAKSLLHGSSYQRKLAILKGRAPPSLSKPKRRTPAFTGRSSGQDKSQHTRSMSTSPDRPRVRGRSPAFNVLTSAFEKPSNTRNFSTPPPAIKKLFPKSGDQSKVSPKKSAIGALTSSLIPKSVKASSEAEKAIQEQGDGDVLGGDPQSWSRVDEPAPFASNRVSCYALHPDGHTVLMSVRAWRPTTAETRPYYHGGRDSTFAFDTEARQWTYIGEWLLPFRGRAYYDCELDALVGVCHYDYEEGPGRLCCCDVPPVSRCEAMPSRRIGAELFFDADSDHHVGATLVYMGDSRFCLLECRAGEDNDDSDGRLRVVEMTSFVLKYDKAGGLRTTHHRAFASMSYQVAHDGFLHPPYPVTFWI